MRSLLRPTRQLVPASRFELRTGPRATAAAPTADRQTGGPAGSSLFAPDLPTNPNSSDHGTVNHEGGMVSSAGAPTDSVEGTSWPPKTTLALLSSPEGSISLTLDTTILFRNVAATHTWNSLGGQI